ncbi:MAG TPA: cupredoxin domain-containing protein [Gaiellaceae bacterium]|nr:cupredoxin domain-containing protein [Gaiellaceae bacterium]
MKKFLLLPVLAAFLLASPTALAATKTVSITNAGFVPNSITIDAGDSITWTNSDAKNHQLTSKNAFTSPSLKPGETYTFQFKADGHYSVEDTLVKNQKMTVTVAKAAAPVGSPSLTANKPKVIFGGAVVLSGKLPVAKAGEKVMLRAEVLTRTGTKQTSSVAEVLSTASGAFTFTTAPSAQTTYTVSWQANPATPTTSSPVTVNVAPRIGIGILKKVGRYVTFSTKATSTIPYAGKSVYVQRRNSLGRWVSLKRVVLKSSTIATRATVRIPRGLSSIRILMPQTQVGVGYVTGASRVILIRL